MKVIVALAVAGLALIVVPRISGNGSGDGSGRAGVEAPGAPSPEIAGPFPEIAERLPETPPSTTARPQAQPSTSTTARPSTSTSTSTTLPVVDEHETQFPITQFLPAETPTWQVDYRLSGPFLTLEITLTPVLNRPEHLASRRQALAAAKTEVLAWLASKGAVPGTYGVIWRPREAETL